MPCESMHRDGLLSAAVSAHALAALASAVGIVLETANMALASDPHQTSFGKVVVRTGRSEVTTVRHGAGRHTDRGCHL